ncbi:VOC family protein [Cohnella rhizosphaerae]|uniref:VOC family protein n=1 Tax=Cohnella rhizosphaerae TaxID=1457232 RepID=A0A9X4QTC6_9BACL|nr:VOC family protein [Cohnella rhizosphaerae]MDG0811001.1 VOC family protein [Cohnella rhizosphaerae]
MRRQDGGLIVAKELIALSIRFVPFIQLDGRAREAIQFYENALGAEVTFSQTFGAGPGASDAMPETMKNRIAHSELKIGDAQLMVADCEPGKNPLEGDLLTICITTPDADQATRMYNALREDGTVITPLGAFHFSPAYGVVKDKFGVTFQCFTSRRRE